MKAKYYYIVVAGCVEPYLEGSFNSQEIRDEKARECFNNELSMEDAIFALDIDEKGVPEVWSFSSSFMEEDDDDEDEEDD